MMDFAAIQKFAAALQSAASGAVADTVTPTVQSVQVGTATFTTAQGCIITMGGSRWIPRSNEGGMVRVQLLDVWIPKTLQASRPDESLKVVFNGGTFKISTIDGDMALSLNWHLSCLSWID